MFARSTSIPRPRASVAIRIRFSKALKAEYRAVLNGKSVDLPKDMKAIRRTVLVGQDQSECREMEICKRRAIYPTQWHEQQTSRRRRPVQAKVNEKKTARGPGTNLKEFQSFKQLVQFSVLSRFVQLHKVLLESVQGQLRFIVNEDFEGLVVADKLKGGMKVETRHTFATNFLHVTLISLVRVALNIMTCLL